MQTEKKRGIYIQSQTKAVHWKDKDSNTEEFLLPCTYERGSAL